MLRNHADTPPRSFHVSWPAAAIWDGAYGRDRMTTARWVQPSYAPMELILRSDRPTVRTTGYDLTPAGVGSIRSLPLSGQERAAVVGVGSLRETQMEQEHG
jgi:hypothetical protein